MVIKRLQRLERPVDVTEFGVVVILDDRRVMAFRPGQQRLAPGHRHRHPERKLMRGRDANDAGRGRQRVHDQALIIDRHADHRGAQGGEQAHHRQVPGVLDRDSIAGLQQDAGHQVDGVLGATGDHDAVFAGRDRTRPSHPAGDGPPQPGLPSRVAVFRAVSSDCGGDPAAPQDGWEQRGIGLAGPQIEPVAGAGNREKRRPARKPAGRAQRRH